MWQWLKCWIFVAVGPQLCHDRMKAGPSPWLERIQGHHNYMINLLEGYIAVYDVSVNCSTAVMLP